MQTILYTDPSSHLEIPDVIYHDDTIWMTQSQMSKLYDTDTSGISRHIYIARIYADGELDELRRSVPQEAFT